MQDNLNLDPKHSALVLIDLQKGIVKTSTQPRSGLEVVRQAVLLAEAFRKKQALVVLVRVSSALDGKDSLHPKIDGLSLGGVEKPEGWDQIIPELGPIPGDLVITKHQWGAFYGTELDLQLRRRKITTIVLGGIATNIGVESTARDAFERGYDQIFLEDAMAAISQEAHTFTLETIFSRLGRIRQTSQILQALNEG